MQITFYSIMMALIWSAFINIGILFFRKYMKTIPYFSVHSLILLYTLCFIRMCFPMEFSFTRIVRTPMLYNWIAPFLYTKLTFVPITPLQIMMIIWFVVSTFLLIRLGKTYWRIFQLIKQLTSIPCSDIEQTYYNLFPQYAFKAQIICHSIFTVPMQIGFFHPILLIPDRKYETDDLRYIIQHEMMHYKKKDTFIKLGINIWRCIFWWFPFTYLLYTQLDESLELRCDYHVTQHMTNDEKSTYLSALLQAYTQQNSFKKDILYNASVAFCKSDDTKTILRRFHYISKPRRKSSFSAPLLILVFVTFFISYGIIFQGAGYPDDKDSRYPSFSVDNAVICHTTEDIYELYVDHELMMILDESQVIKLKEFGMSIIEEENQ